VLPLTTLIPCHPMPPNRPPPVACCTKQLGNNFQLRCCPKSESLWPFHLGRTLVLTNQMTLMLLHNKHLSYCSEYWAFTVWKPTQATAAIHSPLTIIPSHVSLCVHRRAIWLRTYCTHPNRMSGGAM
jgi:hypothetical protein